MPLTGQESASAAAILGVWASPGLGTGFPDLKNALNRIYVDKIAKMPWVPQEWLAGVQQLQNKNPGDLIRPTPGRDANGQRGQQAPSFADTDEKIDVWHKIYNDTNSAIVSYAAAFQAQGASKLADLYASAAFWNAAYSIAKFARDLPANIVGGVLGGVTDFFGTFLPEGLKAYTKIIFWSLVLLIAGAVAVWYRKRLAGLVSGFKKGVA